METQFCLFFVMPWRSFVKNWVSFRFFVASNDEYEKSVTVCLYEQTLRSVQHFERNDFTLIYHCVTTFFVYPKTSRKKWLYSNWKIVIKLNCHLVGKYLDVSAEAFTIAPPSYDILNEFPFNEILQRLLMTEKRRNFIVRAFVFNFLKKNFISC